MVKILKYLKPFIGSIFLVIVLLLVQALCDLSLPDYTSHIVNVGIQQGGIENAVPKVIRKSQLDKVKSFMSEADRKKADANYVLLERAKLSQEEWEAYLKDYPLLEKVPLLLLNTKDQDVIKELNTIFGKPILIVGGLEKNASLPKTAMAKMYQTFEAKLQAMPESMITQAAANFLRQEYKIIGVDTDRLQSNYILLAGLKMLLIALLSAAATITVSFISARMAAAYSRNLRQKVFGKVTQFSIAEFDRFSTASLITRSTNDIQQVQTLLVMFPRIMFYAPILGIGGLIKVLNTNTSMGWIIAVAVGSILLLVALLFGTAIPKFKLMQKLVDRLNLVTREFLTGMLVIRAFNNEKHEEGRFSGVNQDLTNTSLFISRLMSTMMPAMMFIMNGITLLIVWVGAHQIDAGKMQVGNMMAFIQYTMQIIMSFLMISMISIMLPRASVSAQRIAEVLDTEITIRNPQRQKHFDAFQRGSVQFENVSFRYPGAAEDILSDITFTAEPGETTAIIGSTGSGKTTVLNLLLRFYDTTSGQIMIDGIDIREANLQNLREKIGYVTQKAILFSGTIESNIRYGREGASKEELTRFADIAQANEFISSMPEGLQTEISQGGTNLSGGQKQRLAIARALVKQPLIYLFDDSFSALDYKTDAALRKALGVVTKESTLLIVAQRISTIRHAEKIIVLDEGKIVGMGTHEELMQSCEVYQQIAFSQLSKEDLAS